MSLVFSTDLTSFKKEKYPFYSFQCNKKYHTVFIKKNLLRQTLIKLSMKWYNITTNTRKSKTSVFEIFQFKFVKRYFCNIWLTMQILKMEYKYLPVYLLLLNSLKPQRCIKIFEDF